MRWILPEGVTTYAGSIDRIYYLILIITVLAFLIVEIALIVFLVRYRARPGRRAHYTHGNTRIEVVWTVIPAAVILLIGVMSGRVWGQIKGRNTMPADALTIGVMARQFEWNITYPGGDGRLGTADDFMVRNQLHIPAGRPVVLMLEAEDAIHSFFVPEFRVKQDAVPGMRIPVWFEVTTPGEYEIACAELCGIGHYRMRGIVTVHSASDYDEWLAQAGRPLDDAP